MDMPKPTKEHQKLSELAGTWEGEETLAPSPWGPGGKARGKMTHRMDLDGFFLVQDYIEEKDIGPLIVDDQDFGLEDIGGFKHVRAPTPGPRPAPP